MKAFFYTFGSWIYPTYANSMEVLQEKEFWTRGLNESRPHQENKWVRPILGPGWHRTNIKAMTFQIDSKDYGKEWASQILCLEIAKIDLRVSSLPTSYHQELLVVQKRGLWEQISRQSTSLASSQDQSVFSLRPLQTDALKYRFGSFVSKPRSTARKYDLSSDQTKGRLVQDISTSHGQKFLWVVIRKIETSLPRIGTGGPALASRLFHAKTPESANKISLTTRPVKLGFFWNLRPVCFLTKSSCQVMNG